MTQAEHMCCVFNYSKRRFKQVASTQLLLSRRYFKSSRRIRSQCTEHLLPRVMLHLPTFKVTIN